MTESLQKYVLKYLPVLEKLQNYHESYNSIVNFLQKICSYKENEIQYNDTSINKIIDNWEGIVYYYGYEMYKLQERAKKLKELENYTYKTKKKTFDVSLYELSYQYLIESYLQRKKYDLLKKLRQNNPISEDISTKFQRNLQTNKLISLSLSPSPLSYLYRKYCYRFIFCNLCDFYLRTDAKELGQISFYVRQNHFYKEHGDKIWTDKSVTILKSTSAHKKLLPLTKTTPIYKCNCSETFYHYYTLYIEHMLSEHQGQIPPFSSHVEKYGGIVVNPYFPQNCVIEEILFKECYYCGDCLLSFYKRCDLFWEHLGQVHGGNSYHPLTSHTIKPEYLQYISKEKHFPLTKFTKVNKTDIILTKNTNIKKEIHVQNFTEYQIDKYMSEIFRFAKYNTKIKEIFSKENTKIKDISDENEFIRNMKYYIVKKFHQSLYIPCYKNVRALYSLDSFESGIIETIDNFQGPYFCGACNKEFSTYLEIIFHLKAIKGNCYHVRKGGRWMQIVLKGQWKGQKGQKGQKGGKIRGKNDDEGEKREKYDEKGQKSFAKGEKSVEKRQKSVEKRQKSVEKRQKSFAKGEKSVEKRQKFGEKTVEKVEKGEKSDVKEEFYDQRKREFLKNYRKYRDCKKTRWYILPVVSGISIDVPLLKKGKNKKTTVNYYKMDIEYFFNLMKKRNNYANLPFAWNYESYDYYLYHNYSDYEDSNHDY